MRVAYLRVRLDGEPIATKVAFAFEFEYGSGKIVSDLLLLCIIPHSHANMSIASSAEM